MKRLLAWSALVGGLAGIVVVAVTLTGLIRAELEQPLGLRRPAPGEVYAATVQGHRVWISNQNGEVFAFLDDANHMEGGESLWWCHAERLFAAPTHGELFGPAGERIAGPAARGLDRVGVSEHADGSLLINPNDVVPGRRSAPGDQIHFVDPEVWNRYMSGEAWGVGGFCARHAEAGA
jgi:nitrite reductase/ring-hydroxylating ferredoxin subunit